jgi:hypothetical protein
MDTNGRKRSPQEIARQALQEIEEHVEVIKKYCKEYGMKVSITEEGHTLSVVRKRK